MNIVMADIQDIECIYGIVQDTIKNVYPNYYPSEVVDFFLEYHNEEKLMKDIEKGNVYLLSDNDKFVATGTIDGMYIGRVYVLPEYHGKGYGSSLMSIMEERIAVDNTTSYLDASLPSYEFYLKLGYKPTEYHRYEVKNNRMLCYYVMEKVLGVPYDVPVIKKDEENS